MTAVRVRRASDRDRENWETVGPNVRRYLRHLYRILREDGIGRNLAGIHVIYALSMARAAYDCGLLAGAECGIDAAFAQMKRPSTAVGS